MPPVSIGLSPCPNDTFIFHALLHNLIKHPFDFEPHFADVEQLNGLAIKAELPVTKISLGVYPAIAKNYAILDSGAAMGWGVGPLVVARNLDFEPATAKIAIPGKNTTANLLLDLHGGFKGPRQEMLFSDVMAAVAGGEADLGVIIHEGRFTYQQRGLKKILDLGQWWEETQKLPLPLGAIAIRRDLGKDAAIAIGNAIRQSVEYAWAHPEASRSFIAQHAQELDPAVTQSHISTFVTDYSKDLGLKGKEAISALLNTRLADADSLCWTDSLKAGQIIIPPFAEGDWDA